MSKPIQITVGGGGPYDPAIGSTAVSIPLLNGYEFYVEEAGFGTMDFTDWQLKAGGGFTLLNGLVFSVGDIYTIHVTGFALPSNASDYTNGYNSAKVLNALYGRLAWSDSTLSSDNTLSKSGRYFDDGSFHSLVTVANIKKTVPIQSDWNVYLTNKQKAVILRCLNGVFNKPEYLEQVVMYNRFDEVEDYAPNQSKAVGYRVKLADAFDYAVKINSLELYFDSAATFNIYLFKQGSNTPLKTQEVTTLPGEKTTVDLSSWVLKRKESAIYYLCYFQNDLGTTKAIQEHSIAFDKTKMFLAEPFLAASTGATTFQRQGVPLTFLPYGLNMQVVSFKDFTDNIANQPHLFDEMIGLSMAYMIIEDILYAVRSNDNERILKEQLEKFGIQLELTGAVPVSDSPKVIGLRQRIEREMQRVKQAFYPKLRGQSVNLAECYY